MGSKKASPSLIAVLAQAISVKINRFDLALRIWAVRKYRLKQKNPPIYEKVWQADDLAVVKAWEKFKEKFLELRKRLAKENYPAQSMRAVDSFDVGMIEWDRKLRSMGADPDEETTVAESSKEKEEKVSVVGTAVAVSILGVGAYFAAPAIKTLLFPEPKIRQQKPLDIEDITARMLPRRRPIADKPPKGILPEMRQILEEDAEIDKARRFSEMGEDPSEGRRFQMVEEKDD